MYPLTILFLQKITFPPEQYAFSARLFHHLPPLHEYFVAASIFTAYTLIKFEQMA